MQHIIENAKVKNSPWFKSWFDSAYYHKLYSNHDQKEAENFINKLIAHLQPAPDAQMIDVGCGAGRHCKQLAAKGFNVTGFDLALSSIKEVQRYEYSRLHFFQHDMRISYGRNRFDYVFNFFTSFGYFKSQIENYEVVSNMSGALKPGGKLVIDYLNVKYSEEHLVPAEQKDIDGIVYQITRWMDETHFFKKIKIKDNQWGEFPGYIEQVAKFEPGDFSRMLSLYDLEIEEVYGDYELNTYDGNLSPRLIIIAGKNMNQDKNLNNKTSNTDTNIIGRSIIQLNKNDLQGLTTETKETIALTLR